MCNNVFWRFQDCGHRMLQNTFYCHIVRRCRPTDDMLLEKPIFLPQLPRVPAGMLDCKQVKLLRGKDGCCPDCRQQLRQQKQQEQNTAMTAGASSSSSNGITPRSVSLAGVPSASSSSVNMGIQDQGLCIKLPDPEDDIMLGNPPSPKLEAVQAVRNSFLRLSLMQQPTPPEEMDRIGDAEESPLVDPAARMASISEDKMSGRKVPHQSRLQAKFDQYRT